MPKTEKLLYQTVKSIHRRCYIKKDVLKNFAIFTGKYLRTPFLKNICIRLSLKRLYKVIILELFFWTVAFKIILNGNITKIPLSTFFVFIFHPYACLSLTFATQEAPPRWNSPCRGEGAYPPRGSNQSASTRRAQLSVAAKEARPRDLLNHNVKT